MAFDQGKQFFRGFRPNISQHILTGVHTNDFFCDTVTSGAIHRSPEGCNKALLKMVQWWPLKTHISGADSVGRKVGFSGGFKYFLFSSLFGEDFQFD